MQEVYYNNIITLCVKATYNIVLSKINSYHIMTDDVTFCMDHIILWISAIKELVCRESAFCGFFWTSIDIIQSMCC